MAGLVLTGLIIALGTAAPASANFSSLGHDPAGDSTDPHPARDILKVGFAYDRRSGHIRGGVQLAGTPGGSSAANLTLFAGHRTATGCNGFPAIGFGTQTDLTGADWVLLSGPGKAPVNGSARKLYDARAEEYEATERRLRGKRPNCLIAQLNEPGNPGLVYDVAGPFRLRGLPELEARLGKLPARMRPGKTRKIRVTLRNPGDGPTGRLRLSVSRARGLKVRMPGRLGTIRPGKSRRVTLRVTLNRRARTFTTLRFKARASSGVRARIEGDLRLVKSSRPGKGGGGSGGSSSGSGLCYAYDWLPPYSKLVPC